MAGQQRPRGSIGREQLCSVRPVGAGELTDWGECMIDIHNYARWNGQITGQREPTDDQFASLWRVLTKPH